MTNYDKTLPAGGVTIRLGDDKIRDNYAAIEEALSVEHNFPDNAGGNRRGRHKFGVGTQAARSAAVGTPATGEVWFDTTYYQWSVYDGTAWRALGSRVADIKMVAIPIIINGESWLVCNGQLASRATYTLLFASIGTTYNIPFGDPGHDPTELTTHFRLPNMGGRSPVGQVVGGDADGHYGTQGSKYGEKMHTLDLTEMPQHNHPGSSISNAVDVGGVVLMYQDGSTTGHFRGGGATLNGAQSFDTGDLPNHTHTLALNPQGDGFEHENRPPLITLGFMIFAGV